MIRTCLILVLSLLLVPASGYGNSQADATLAFHAVPEAGAPSCGDPALSIPCSTFNTEAELGTGYYVYAVLANGAPTGFTGVRFAIQYDGASGSGVDVLDWTACGGQANTAAWPAPGSIASVFLPGCQLDDPGEGVQAIVGVFYVTAYGADILRASSPPVGGINIADCAALDTFDLPLDQTGFVSFSAGATDPGCNPCLGPCSPPADDSPPFLYSASSLNPQSVLIAFSEPMTVDSALLDPINYEVVLTANPAVSIPVTALTDGDAYSVTLALGAPLSGSTGYTARAGNLRDLAGNLLPVGASVDFETPPGGPPVGGDPKIAFHVQPHQAKSRCTTNAPIDVPCSQFVQSGDVGPAYDVYVLVVNGSTLHGIAGAAFGIDYNGQPGQGVDIYSWSLCADLEFPGPNWPESQTHDVVTFNSISNCQDQDVGGEGVQALLGVFYLSAYSADVLAITPRYISLPDLAVADCSARETALPSWAVGKAGFGGDMGYNPCLGPVQVKYSTWGGIKRQYGNE